MPYKIKNLLKVSRYAPKQGKNRKDKVLQDAFTRLKIGRVIHIGKSAVISDDVFASNKDRIEHLEKVGAITVESLGASKSTKDSGAPAPKAAAPKVVPVKVEPKKVEAVKPEPKKEAPAKEEQKVEQVKAVAPVVMEKAPEKKSAPEEAPVVKASTASEPEKAKSRARKTSSPRDAAKRKAAASKNTKRGS